MRRSLAIIGVALLLVLAGCTSGTGMSVDEAIEGSEAVDDVTLSNENGQIYMNVYINESVQQNDEYCWTQYNPATKVTQTYCNDDWKAVDVTEVTVVREGTVKHFENESLNGERLRVPVEEGEYQIQFTSEKGTSTFGVAIVEDDGGLKIAGAGYNDEI